MVYVRLPQQNPLSGTALAFYAVAWNQAAGEQSPWHCRSRMEKCAVGGAFRRRAVRCSLLAR